MDPCPSKRTLRLAVDDLNARGHEGKAEELQGLISKLYPPGRMGRSVPGVGESRPYKVQKDTRGSEYVRIPPHVLQRTEGQVVKADFQKGRIVLTPGD